jgi:hypothetical protein
MTAAYEPDLVHVLERAIGRLRRGLGESSPVLAAVMDQWLEGITGRRTLVDYFTQLRAFPIMLFPWWMEARWSQGHDLEFQENLACSSVSGYLYIRMIDNVMDEPDPAEIRILPLANCFHSQFQSVYLEYFPFGDPFWDVFHRTWLQSAEASLLDAGQDLIDERRFLEVAARKTCAGKIPLAAVCRRCGRTAVPDPWLTVFDRMAAVHQMSNDLFDFQRDLDARNATYFLSEGMRRKREAETVSGWVVREGFDWGVDLLDRWLEELASCAEACGSPGLERYVELRVHDLSVTSREVSDGLRSMRRVLELTP